ncbi:MAG: hypothetical protein R3F44_09360 [Candidatus Competibacteraceae bacterium]
MARLGQLFQPDLQEKTDQQHFLELTIRPWRVPSPGMTRQQNLTAARAQLRTQAQMLEAQAADQQHQRRSPYNTSNSSWPLQSNNFITSGCNNGNPSN